MPTGSPGGQPSAQSWWAVLYRKAAGRGAVLDPAEVPSVAFVQAASAEDAASKFRNAHEGDAIDGTPLGPFGTQVEAQKAAGQQTDQIAAATQAGSLPNPFAALGEIAHWAGVIITAITDIHMWISLGWIFLGVGLVLLGLMLWLRIPVAAPVGGLR